MQAVEEAWVKQSQAAEDADSHQGAEEEATNHTVPISEECPHSDHKHGVAPCGPKHSPAPEHDEASEKTSKFELPIFCPPTALLQGLRVGEQDDIRGLGGIILAQMKLQQGDSVYMSHVDENGLVFGKDGAILATPDMRILPKGSAF